MEAYSALVTCTTIYYLFIFIVFVGKNVDETRHQMKLSDFTLSDITKFLGNKVCPSDASNDHQAVPETTEVAAQQQGFNGETSPHIQAATSNTISSSAAKNNLPSLRGTSAETQEASGRKPNHSSDAARVSTGRDLTDESHTKIPTLNSTTSDNVTSQQHVEFDLSSSGSPSQCK